MVVEVSTDKINRSIAKIRDVVKECGGKMADSGSVLFKFTRARVVNIKVTDADKDQLLGIALDAGAEDVIDPPTYEDDTEEDKSERYCSHFCFTVFLSYNQISGLHKNKFYDLIIISLMKPPHPIPVCLVYGVCALCGGNLQLAMIHSYCCLIKAYTKVKSLALPQLF